MFYFTLLQIVVHQIIVSSTVITLLIGWVKPSSVKLCTGGRELDSVSYACEKERNEK